MSLKKWLRSRKKEETEDLGKIVKLLCPFFGLNHKAPDKSVCDECTMKWECVTKSTDLLIKEINAELHKLTDQLKKQGLARAKDKQ